eukprot:gene13165-15474_t
MMLGTRKEFAYAQCTKCKTIQIINVPEDIIAYYPDYYYSFKQEIPKLKNLPILKRLFKNFRMKKRYRRGGYEILRHLEPLHILPSQKILDIGCGKGKLICDMFNAGFTNIQGVDKFIDQEYDYGYNVKVIKSDLSELEKGSYDFLMMHHVFEHMAEPLQEFHKCRDLLKNNAYLMVRIPVIGKAWEIYQQDWVQLDAPRHFFIHSEESMKILADNAGFTITKIVYDSTSFQFWGSELYRRDIPLVKEETKEYISAKDFFSDEEITSYEKSAADLNSENRGDQAIFYLQKKVK